ncbi:pyridoxamine 5'-phosphate oxidase family protein [Streptomyces antnestii]|uniref:Pyridoxamine 5'-phosphate oxidase family protein n=1 Tax=Streptomyces antnestii TaxID=2494256 RepID=A0A3S2W3Z9_9ACTN|nr:pyridoxamine 5'-phosphate oxidase family protein [Streptomyces sp. San01]RVU27338.1 pyridoxamine 5'-phosphate oxidase family protein [Streptomyces sp. San01]
MPSEPSEPSTPSAPSAPEEARADAQRAIELIGSVDYGRVATSMRALPFLAAARHIVVDGRLLLRMHQGYGYHQACSGSVVAYGADNLHAADPTDPADGQWSVQFVGTCEAVEPTPRELELFGPAPLLVDGKPYTPVYLRVEPQFVTVHELTGGARHPKRGLRHFL